MRVLITVAGPPDPAEIVTCICGLDLPLIEAPAHLLFDCPGQPECFWCGRPALTTLAGLRQFYCGPCYHRLMLARVIRLCR